jgi:3-dehydroquinate dehydratase type I
MTCLAVSLAESDRSQLQKKIHSLVGQVSVIEVRFDHLEPPGKLDLPGELGGTRLLATCRPLPEGGQYRGPEVERLRLLKWAIHAGFDWVDLEWDVEVDESFPVERLVRSRHIFDSFPQDLRSLWTGLCESPGAIHKLAIRVGSTAEVIRLLDLMESLPESRRRVILGMGEKGRITRFLGGSLQNEWTYVSGAEDCPVAPGQFSLRQATQAFRLHRILPEALLFGAALSLDLECPFFSLHNQLLERMGIPGLCFPIDWDDSRLWFNYLKGSKLLFRGFAASCSAIEYAILMLDNRALGCDTFVLRKGQWVAEGLGAPVFLRLLQQRFPSPGDLTALVLGGNAFAEMVVVALRHAGAEVFVVADPGEELRPLDKPRSFERPIRFDICVDTLSPGDRKVKWLTRPDFEVDVLYDLGWPAASPIRWAEPGPAREVVPGKRFLVDLVGAQSKFWHGIEPDYDFLWDTCPDQEEQR